MRDFISVIEILKAYIAKQKEGKVLDKDVAALLGMSQARLATLKKRNTLPYESILLFCKR